MLFFIIFQGFHPSALRMLRTAPLGRGAGLMWTLVNLPSLRREGAST